MISVTLSASHDDPSLRSVLTRKSSVLGLHVAYTGVAALLSGRSQPCQNALHWVPVCLFEVLEQRLLEMRANVAPCRASPPRAAQRGGRLPLAGGLAALDGGGGGAGERLGRLGVIE